MIYDAFLNVYRKFKMHFYREAFKKTSDSDANLTVVETFCMEAILILNRPTISQFAEFMSLSSANAADKVNNLVKKGYLMKIQAEGDRRKYYLEVTPKYLNYYNFSYEYLRVVLDRVSNQFSDEELGLLEKLLTVIDKDLMSEFQAN